MRITVDGTPLIQQRSGYLSRRSGVGNYIYNLLKSAMAIAPSYKYRIIGFFSFKDRLRKPGRTQKSFPKLPHSFVLPLFPRQVYTRLVKYGVAPPFNLLSVHPADIYFFPNYVRFPIISKAKTVVVVYDLSFVKVPQFVDTRNRIYLQKCVPRSVAKASHVVTISENSKREIVETYKINPKKITVLYPAVDHSFFKPQSASVIRAMKEKYKIKNDYVLFTSTLEPRKNITGLIDAYAGLPKQIQGSFSLVLAGSKGWLDRDIEQKLHQYKELDVKLLGYVPDADLPALYSGANLFVYPSFYEGFGMPPLEAMACGTPVIVADNSSLPEVVGKAGLLVKAEDTQALSNALEKVLTEPKLAARMRHAGLAQAKKFSWEKSARQLVAVFKALR